MFMIHILPRKTNLYDMAYKNAGISIVFFFKMNNIGKINIVYAMFEGYYYK